MRPPLNAGENIQLAFVPSSREAASMRPPLNARENQPPRRNLRPLAPASMRPPLNAGENLSVHVPPERASRLQ